MKKRLEKHHAPGQSYCLVRENPASSLIYVNIPKNASSWAKHHMHGHSFDYRTKTFHGEVDAWKYYEHVRNDQYIVILRDPVIRWASGLAQYMQGYGPNHSMHVNNVDWDIIFRTVVFDGHTWPQCEFIQGIDHSKIIWLQCNNDLEKNFLAVIEQFTGTPCILTTKDQDTTNRFNIASKKSAWVTPLFTTELQINILDRINEKIASNTTYLNRLRSFYREDCELFESVNY